MVFENWVLKRTSGQNGDEVTGGWRKLHNEKLHNKHSSTNIISMIKSVHVRRGMHAGFWWDNQKERVYLEDLDIDKRIILK
jgi:hypothetical protein